MSRPHTPRFPQPYSPRMPSPLGFPPMAPHVAFQQPAFSWPHTPDRPVQPKGPTEVRIALPQEARRPPLAGTTQRPRSQPPPPLELNDSDRPYKLAQPPKTATISEEASRRDSEPPSPALIPPAEVKKSRELEIMEVEEKPSTFCGCFGFLFGKSAKTKAREAKILGPPAAQSPRLPQTAQPMPSPQMVQVPQAPQVQPTRKRPSPLNL
ncbi:hypothetical protein CPB83DRAFT_465159 [Crepidotus variabilis]|uniref:Uncharacterized protein n=1 Tax=Crepidotus variabilis TaxID=179855 RepID=A0A9P6ECB2_9AGAR|nr:hypothetical protein CPB83DRAFT_465159 [Crepidotus variabilis]